MESPKRLDTYTCHGESITGGNGRFKFNLTPFTNLNYELIHFNNVVVTLFNPTTFVKTTPPLILKCDELGSDFSIVIPNSGVVPNPIMFHWNKQLPIELNFNLFVLGNGGILVPFETIAPDIVLYAFTIQFLKC